MIEDIFRYIYAIIFPPRKAPPKNLSEFAAGLPAAQVDESLRQALCICDRARECAVQWFAEVQRRGLYRPLGFASLQLYATRGLGFSDNRYRRFKRLADDLARLPMLREAVASGEVGWTKAQQVARVATAATQAAWVAKATTNSRRESEQQVRKARKRIVAAAQLGFDVEEQPVADPPVTISLRADGVQLARFEALACDARIRRPGKPNRATIKPSIRAEVLARDRHRCVTPGCRSVRFLEVHHVKPRRQGGSNRAENLITLCSRCHAFAHEHARAVGSGALAPGALALEILAPAQVPTGGFEIDDHTHGVAGAAGIALRPPRQYLQAHHE